MQEDWERRHPHVDLDRETLEALLRPAFPGRALVEVEPLSGGLANTNYRALLAGMGSPVVVRVYTRDPTACHREIALHRLVGDRVTQRLGSTRTVRLSGACAASGAVVIVLAHDLAVGLIGFALLGIGVAVVVPLVFAAAGRAGPHPARGVAGVAGIAYGSGLAAPGVIGGIASATSLRTSFGVVAGLVATMLVTAGFLRGGHPSVEDLSSLRSRRRR